MKDTKNTIKSLKNGEFDKQFEYVYSCDKASANKYATRYINAINEFQNIFGVKEKVALFSAPGRTEIGGNHTDHQKGCVLAAAVDIDVIAVVSFNEDGIIRIKSEGYDMDEVDLDNLDINENEYGKPIALIRGVVKKFSDLGCEIKGFDAYTTSNVLKGSGLSSSAAFEVLVGTILNGLFMQNQVGAEDVAKFGKFAENVYYNKPSGLMDQVASSVGSSVFIDFANTQTPIINKIGLGLNKYEHALCIIDTGADHAGLTDEYAAVPREMSLVASFFGKEYLRDVDEDEFYSNIKELRKSLNNDRAIIRAMHFFAENLRAQKEAQMLQADDFEAFLQLVKESGRSSYMYLQNVYATFEPAKQAVSLSIALCEKILGERGAFRVHGGGFAGTVQAFVPFDMLKTFKSKIESVLGEGKCHILSLRPVGGYEFKI